MIDPAYAQTMARYNAWQNDQLIPVLKAMTLEDLKRDRGAFFGSIFATANHLLWGDTLWMNRFDPSVAPPAVPAKEHATLHSTITSWAADRFRMDGKIRSWAEGLRAQDLKGQLSFYSGSLQREITSPLDASIVHFFSHQTHHRGQIHAMLTAAGQKAPVTDLWFMPEDA